MKLGTLAIFAVVGFGLYKGVIAVGGEVDHAMAEGRGAAPPPVDASGRPQDVRIDLKLAYAESKTRATTQYDALNAGKINLRGTVTNDGPAARSIEVRVKWQDKNYGSPVQSEVVDLGAFGAGETRSFDDMFANTFGAPDKDGSRNYALDFTISLERVVR